MNKLILGNLVHRPLRSIISALAVAIEVVMILSIAAIMYGILNGSRTQTNGIGMDMMVRKGVAGSIMSTSAASADVRTADVLRQLPHVQVVSPVNIKLTLGTSVENINGIDFASYNALRPFNFVSGTPFQQPYDVIIDDVQALSGTKPKVGDTIKILNHAFRVCGIVEHGKGGRKYIPLTTMDDMDGTPNKASAFYLRTEDSPKFQKDVRDEILATDGMAEYSVQTLDEFLAGLTPEHIPAFSAGLNTVIGLAVIIGFIVIFQSMYTAVMERTREIGILKSMGAGRLTIVSVILRETGLLAVVGVVLGVLTTYAIRWLIHAHINPTLSFQITLAWIIKAVCIALTGALFGALYPAWKAARKDPIDALSYE